MLRYSGTTYGKFVIEQEHGGEKCKYTIDIREANCLCAFIYVRKATKEELAENPEGKYYHQLYSFLVDARHGKNIINAEGKLFGSEKVVKITLNMFYKESYTLLKLFMKSGYKVNCYYEEPKKKAKK